MVDFSFVSHLIAAIAFSLLALLVGTRYLRRTTDRALFMSAIVSALWSFAIVAQVLWDQPSFPVRFALELTRDFAWVAVLLALIRDGSQNRLIPPRLKALLGLTAGVFITILVGFSVTDYLTGSALIRGQAAVLGQLVIALLGISLIEQIWRNSMAYGRSSIKYICFGIGGIFVYDFFLYADALLFNQISSPLWDARGSVNAIATPLLAVNMINARKQPIQLQLSRSVVFHAGTLTLAGLYLMVAAAGGYYVRQVGGSWGEALQVLFLSLFISLFVLMMTSTRFRSRLMVFISQNFFDYKYDYREEWLKITEAFSSMTDSPPLTERVVRVIADLVESNAGALWIKDEEGQFTLTSSVNMAPPKHTRIDGDSDLVRFFREREWILDLKEYKQDPVRYNLLEVPDSVMEFHDPWLVIPLYLGRDLYGIALVGSPFARVELNWENFDLIRVVARQVCNFLAQADAQSRLAAAMQFEAVSKASAFMVHDLKTIIAQLSLLARNAPRHRDNPEFIDDMIRTTEHAVKKMSNLVDHIRRPNPEDKTALVNLTELCRELEAHHSVQKPPLSIDLPEEDVWIRADEEQLRTVLSHLIQNARDATHNDGEISLTLKLSTDQVVLFLQDTGAGMTDDFIKTRLFKPFESTKGLTGMGIGAYQAREYFRKLGGSLDVTSEVGVGSCFSIRLQTVRDVEEKESSSATA
ncbi:XrtA/PEP-CTERM system histidine kinase PrsK [Hydrocarboniclastica marina]|uniref:histidine kinase n=1 Tax=Hydrocarboniclastica marina TaxID=2259620 RepID=A0A4P7XGX1_9ALTE|nr:XrtA/PEP-CTERM system histidine kinase PrsK [Hydrocarboniclastica marina]MAL97839.1 PEP-CTERM system histidine kinase PrsK [Alteromonadaceae bacterium]QCF26271.1 PEP-CTERM system histidine kinase PrsK [Hydrocarboniclastica marina]